MHAISTLFATIATIMLAIGAYTAIAGCYTRYKPPMQLVVPLGTIRRISANIIDNQPHHVLNSASYAPISPKYQAHKALNKAKFNIHDIKI